ncbi:MAG TPA: rhomboid family intramembrane serine protease [Desulfonatronum sp.]|nr:rhomboid family intramembrane serine protease [Desulfonatronum sp.]
MIPLRDTIPSRTRSHGMWLIILANTLVFLFQVTLPETQYLQFTHLFGLVPARIMHPDWAQWAGYPTQWGMSLATHMFVHAGWLHFLLNMWMLWIFGDNVEDVMGPVRFILFYMLCGLGAILAHVLFNTDSTVPVVGASGAIAGIMGAYLLLYPHARVVAFVPIFFLPYFFEVPAVVFLGVWFLIQIVSGLFSLMFQSDVGGGIAWWAHIGGFVMGMVLVKVFQKRDICRHCTSMEQWFREHSRWR